MGHLEKWDHCSVVPFNDDQSRVGRAAVMSRSAESAVQIDGDFELQRKF